MGANAKDLGALARNLDMRNRIEKSVKVPTLPSAMSKADAILYARHLFGPMGAVTKGKSPIPKDYRCMVGRLEDSEERTAFRIAGVGGTWEEAFARAEATLEQEKKNEC